MPYPGQITQRVFAHVPTNMLSLAGADYVRKLYIGSNWTRLRIGVLLSLPNIYGPLDIRTGGEFRMGLCTSAGRPVGCTNTGYFLGVSTGTGIWTYTTSVSSTTFPSYVSGAMVMLYKRGNDYTLPGQTTSGALRLPIIDPSSAGTNLKWANRRFPVILDIWRQPAQWGPAIQMACYAHTTAGNDDRDCRPGELIEACDSANVAPIIQGDTLTAICVNNNSTMYPTDAGGPLDSVNLYWSKTFPPMLISAIVVTVVNEGVLGYTEPGLAWDNFEAYGTGSVATSGMLAYTGSGFTSPWVFRSEGTNLPNPDAAYFTNGSFPSFGSQNWFGFAGTRMWPFDTMEDYAAGSVTSLNGGSFWASAGTVYSYGSAYT